MPHSIHLAMNPPRFVKKRGVRNTPMRRAPTKGFRWPLESLGLREPSVLREHDGGRRGVDLGYEPRPYDADLFVPVFAANDGEVACALESPTGSAISIDHGGTWTTHYTGISKVFVIPCLPRLRRRESVRAGQVIGYAAKSPIRIGFELWQWTNADGFVAVDPLPHIANWAHAPKPVGVRTKEAA
ncbi:hypothetical protein BH11MYX2_BH11MYX2_36890 [soil metagenome]